MNGNLEAALQGASKLLQAAARESQWRRNRGEFLVSLGRYPEALEKFNRYISIAPRNGGAYSLRAAVHRRLRQYEQAIADYGEAIDCLENGRRAAWIYYHRGTPQWIAGRPEQAAADYAKAYELLTYPTYANARLYLVLQELQRRAQAEHMLAEARSRLRNDPWLATIFACLGREITPSALAEAADPSMPQQLCEAYYYAAETCLVQDKTQEARFWFQKCRDTGMKSDPLNHPDPMSEYELAEWRLRQLVSVSE